jgi:hypothetical protein
MAISMKKKTIAIVAGIAVFAAVSASAATLGGLTTGDVGANSNTVAGQLTQGVNVSFTTAYDSTLGGYKVTGVTLTANGTEKFPANGAIALTLKNTSGTSLTELTLTPTTAAATETIPYSGATISAYSVGGVSLVVNGGATTAAVATNP